MRPLPSIAVHRVPAAVLVVVLLSGAGLLTAGLVSLARAARAAEVRARAEAGVAAERSARVLRAALQDPALLDALPPETTFTLEDGSLVVPDHVGWIERPPPLALPWTADTLLREAQRLELEGDSEAAAGALARAREAAADDPATRAAVLARIAWLGCRQGSPATRDEALAALETRLDSVPPRVLASVLLLRARIDGTVPDPAVARFGAVPTDVARGVLALLEQEGIDVAPLRRAWRDAAARREVLRAARRHAAALRGAAQPQLRLEGDRLLLHVPDSPGHGRGAVTDVRAALAAARTTAVGAALEGITPDDLALGTLPDEARAVVPGVLGVRPATAAAPRSAFDPFGLGGLLVLLALCFAVGLALAFRALRRESRALAVRGEFLTMVSHELKTPVASIRLLAELLGQRRVRDPAKRAEHLRLLGGEAVRLAVLVENVLDLGRTERGERSYDRRPCDPAALVREAAEVFAPIAADAGLAVTLALDPTPRLASLDRHAITQVLLNVLDNARRYAAGGGVVEIVGRADAAAYRVTVRDRGPGVPDDERERIFGRFRRGRREASGHVPGVGVGLYLAREIARAHGGDLRCVSPADGGAGACLVLSVPLAEEEAAP